MQRRQSVFSLVCVAILLIVASPPQAARAANIVGVAAMGASETQGTGYDGSWVPYLANERGLNFGLNQSYNVAVGGSSSAVLLADGQHTQVASLVGSGNVNLAFLTIGGLDFPPKAQQILTNTLNIPAFVNQVVGNINTAVDAVLLPGTARMIVSSIPDMTLTGGGQRTLITPLARTRTLNVVNAVNAALKPDILGRGQTYVDLEAAMQQWTNHPLIVGGVTINTHDEGASPDHLWLNDLHVAVVGNALFANLMLSAINKSYNLSYPLFSDEFILQKAGLSAQYVGHQTSNLDYQSFVYLPVAVPEPSTGVLAGLALVGVVGLCLRNIRHSAVSIHIHRQRRGDQRGGDQAADA